MPFWGLVLSSAMFAIPTLIAYQKRRKMDMVMNGTLTLSSIAFHSTWHPFIRIIDVVYAHVYAGVYIVCRISSLSKHPGHLVFNMLSLACGGASAAMYYGISKKADSVMCNVTHMIMHAMVISTMSVYLAYV